MSKEDTELEERTTGRIEAAPFLAIMLVVTIPLYFLAIYIFVRYQTMLESGLGRLSVFIGPIVVGMIISWPIWLKVKKRYYQ